ncbi:hypothetical protein EYR36_007787 [Pleurotus pulmonarius]|nr:hypothetical protein EYR36_007787 [Pleurotus pulmonarius]
MLEPLFVSTQEEPELDPTDRAWIREEPLRGWFRWLRETDNEGRDSNYAKWKADLKTKILEEHPTLTRRTTNWLTFCLNGSSLPIDLSVDTFIDVFACLALDQDYEAREILNAAQQKFLDLPTPTKFNMLTRTSSDEDDEESGNNDESSEEDEAGLRVLETLWEAKMPTQWKAKIREDPTLQALLCTELTSNIRRGAIEALQQMRKISAGVWKQVSWHDAVKESGLATLIITICQQGYMYTLQSPHVLETYRYNVWRETLGEILHRWTPEDIRELQVKPSPSQNKTICTAATVLQALCEHEELIPRNSHPSSIFFLANDETFCHAWEVWLQGGLERFGLNTDNVNLVQLHRNLRGIKLEPFEKVHSIPEVLKLILTETNKLVDHNKRIRETSARPGLKDTTNPPTKSTKASKKKRPPKKRSRQKAKDALLQGASPLLPPSSRASSSGPSPSPTPPPSSAPESPLLDGSAITEQEQLIPPLLDLATSAPKAEVSEKENFTMPADFKNTCNHCNGRTEEEWCIRRVLVQELADHKNYEGYIITTASEDDRLPPKVTKNVGVSEPRYIHPDDIGLHQIKARPEVYQRCKRDVTLFVNGGRMVGAVQYQAFDVATLQEMDDHKQRTTHLNDVKRGVSFREFAWGSMKALGSRLPQGGNPGSGYGPYKDMVAREVEDIKLMFKHARIADTLIKSGQCLYLPVTKGIGQQLVAQGLDPLGSIGGNLFICHNYCSPVHLDRDHTMSVCMQLKKKCQKGEWNFVFLRWGVYLDNDANTLWLFNANDSHASTMPSKTTMEMMKRNIVFARQHVQQRHGVPEAPARQELVGDRGGGARLNFVNGGAGEAGAIGNEGAYFGDHGNPPPLAYPGGLVWIVVNPGDASTGYHCSARSRDVVHASHYQQVRRQMPAVERYWA